MSNYTDQKQHLIKVTGVTHVITDSLGGFWSESLLDSPEKPDKVAVFGLRSDEGAEFCYYGPLSGLESFCNKYNLTYKAVKFEQVVKIPV